MRPDRRIRVLYVINGLGTGGAERSLADLLAPLERRGIDVTVACLYRRNEGVEKEVSARYDVRFVGPGVLRSIKRIRELIRDLAPDVVHTTIFESDVIGRLSSIGMGSPVITSIVNTSYTLPHGDHPDVSMRKLAIAKAIDGFTARHLNAGFHALTETAAGATTEALGVPRESIVVIPRGRDPVRLGEPSEMRRNQTRQRLGLTGDQTVLLSVGRQEHQKGQVHAIEALALLLGEFPDSVLLVAGRDGAASNRLRERVTQLGLSPAVRFLGHRRDVPDLMTAADLLLFPSLYEGFGGTLIEAMALKIPIVASDLPVVREVVGNAALLAEPGSAQELALGAGKTLSNPALANELRVAGRRRFEQRFTVDNVTDQMATLYRNRAAL